MALALQHDDGSSITATMALALQQRQPKLF